MALTFVLSTGFPSGVFSPSANVASYVVNGAGIIIQLLNATAESALIPAEIVAQVVIGINLVLQVYFGTTLSNQIGLCVLGMGRRLCRPPPISEA